MFGIHNVRLMPLGEIHFAVAGERIIKEMPIRIDQQGKAWFCLFVKATGIAMNSAEAGQTVSYHPLQKIPLTVTLKPGDF